MTITLNNELQGIEISFSEKPSSDILTALKAHKFRWHGVKKLWYAKQNNQTMNFIKGLECGEIKAVATDAPKANKEVKNVDGYKVGDLFYTSWGYEQTNIDFYQVVKVTAKSITVKEIASRETRTTENMSGYVVPVKDKFIDDGKHKSISSTGHYKIDGRYYLSPTDETTEKLYTSYY